MKGKADPTKAGTGIEKLTRRLMGLTSREAIGWTPLVSMKDVLDEILSQRYGLEQLVHAIFPIEFPGSHASVYELSDKFAILLYQLFLIIFQLLLLLSL